MTGVQARQLSISSPIIIKIQTRPASAEASITIFQVNPRRRRGGVLLSDQVVAPEPKSAGNRTTAT